MPWLLTLHITALLCWCGALLYLPALVVASYSPHDPGPDTALRHKHLSLPRVVYCWVATPAALVAIIAGTLVFYRYQIFDLWLILKLALVVGLVVLHLLAGLLIARAEHSWQRYFKALCYAMASLMLLTITAILWLVLAKPLRDF